MSVPKVMQTVDVPAELIIPNGETQTVFEDGRSIAKDQRTIIRVGRGATLTYVATFFARTAYRRTITVALEEQARAELIGFVVGADAGKATLTLNEDHVRGASWGRTTVYSLLAGASQLALRGLISIRPAANGSDGLFEGRAILLSRRARATVIPSLEIEARDVKATHRTAVSPIDPEQAFYCETRGCTLSEAQTLITHGFFEQLLNRLPDAAERDTVRAQWQTLLP